MGIQPSSFNSTNDVDNMLRRFEMAGATFTIINGITYLNTSVMGIVSGTFTPQGLTTKGIITMLSIDNTQWYLAPASPLLLRNNIQVQNPSSSSVDIIWNYDNTQPLSAGLHIPPGGSYSVAIRGSIPVYLTAASAVTIVCPVEELE